MKAIVFHGVGDIRLEDVPEPKIQAPTDAIVCLTASAICGTDLHMIRGTMSMMQPGTILGHEGVGIIEELGPDVRNLNIGERVVIASTIACGYCVYCRAGYFAQCDQANPRGPAAAQSQQQAPQFEEELEEIAPEADLEAEQWRPGSRERGAGSGKLIPCSLLLASRFRIGVYPPTVRSFPIGLAMNKNLTINMGNCNHRKYIPMLIDMVRSGEINPASILTQHEPLGSAVEAYRACDERQPGWVKVKLEPVG